MFAADIQKSLRAQGHKEGHDEGYKKGLKENRDAAGEREKLEARKGQGANLTPGSPAGATDLNKARRDYFEGRITTAEAEKLGIV